MDYQTNPVYEGLKRIFDLVFSLVAMVILSPLFLVVSLAIMAEDGRPVFYRSRRVGLRGKPIQVLKFRSMKNNADDLEQSLSSEELEEYRKNYKLDQDPRVTKVGAFLRKTSLDELPQLLNIFLGTLSFVGPRPVLQEETELYEENRDLLLSCKPGLTGLWQSRGRSNVTYEDGARQAMELDYVRRRGFLLDLKILFWTVGAVVRMDGAR